MESQKLNANPVVRTQTARTSARERDASVAWLEEQFAAGAAAEGGDMEVEPQGGSGATAAPGAPARDRFTAEEVYDLVKDVRDPEHPLSLAELNVVSPGQISVDDEASRVDLYFTPTVPHCSMSTLIGLCLRVKLLRSLPPRFKVDIFVEPGSHVSESQVNKQLNDKERVAAALENGQLVQVVNKCLSPHAA